MSVLTSLSASQCMHVHPPMTMRTAEDARIRWQATFANASDLSALRAGVHGRGERSPCNHGLRSVCWKAFLVFENLDRSTWQTIITESRSAYTSLREHFLRLLLNPDEDSSVDPLADVEGSPWNALRLDELLREEILQDVERCMPEYPFFRELSTKNALLDILFIYCKLNADVGYRQGMHELLAPIYWAVSQDAIKTASTDSDENDSLMFSVLDKKYVEHDAFTLFCIVMQTAKSFYDNGNSSTAVAAGTSTDSPIIARSQRIYNGYLRRTDRELMTHLKSIDILPQIFILRWIRLLFGREFVFEDVLPIWDLLFAEDPTFKLIDLVCVAMLLRIRWQLLDADYTSALSLLLRYPAPLPEHCPMSFVEDAMYLRTHMNPEGGSHLISKYTGKAPTMDERRNKGLHTPQTSIDHTHQFPIRSPSRYIQESGGIENIIQEAAKGVYKRSEKLGLNQALRGAMQQLQSVNNSPRRYIAAARRSMDEAPGSDQHDVHRQIESLENRNRALAKLVQAAMDEVSEQARSLEEGKHETAANQLTLIVAKLQFVHVYLDNPAMPFNEEPLSPAVEAPTEIPRSPEAAPVEDEETITWSPVEPKDQRGRSPAGANRAVASMRGLQLQPTAPVVRESPTRKYVPRRRPPSDRGSTPPAPHTQRPVAPGTSPSTSITSPLQKSRPSLAQSSFSWMLGGPDADREKGGFTTASPFPPEHERRGVTDSKTRGRAGFLFGDAAPSSTTKTGPKAEGQELEREDDDGFTMGTLRGVGERS